MKFIHGCVFSIRHITVFLDLGTLREPYYCAWRAILNSEVTNKKKKKGKKDGTKDYEKDAIL